MPSSNPETIPTIIEIAWRLSPRSVLDIGAGYGKYGVLFREYLELRHCDGGVDVNAHPRADARKTVRIDAVEGFPEYVGDLHRATYDEIHATNILDFLRHDWSYDLIFMGDVLEHIEKDIATRNLLPT